MPDREAIERSVIEAVKQYNQGQPEPRQIPEGGDTKLLGEEGRLDSLGLARLIVAVEQQVTEDFGAVITLADDRAFSQTRSPFRTMGALTEYVTQLLGQPVGD